MAKRLIPEPVDVFIHHFICAHVARRRAFVQQDRILLCPKCHRRLATDRSDWETLPGPSLAGGDEAPRCTKAVLQRPPTGEGL